MQANYGIDAPGVIRKLTIASICCGIGMVITKSYGLGFPSAIFAIEAIYMIWSSKTGQLLQRDRILAMAALTGKERVLDAGCGRGLLLIGAAKQLKSSGKAIGVDLWQQEDLSGNNAEATQKNIATEGVASRVELHTGDMRELPLPDLSVDVVLSSMAVHNIYEEAGREKALLEMVRVLKPRGRLFLQDFRHTAQYVTVLRNAGLADAKRSGLQWNLFPPARIVSAVKPNPA